MLMKNPDYRDSESRVRVHAINKLSEKITPREMIIGQLALIALVALAILLRWLS